MNEIRVYQPGTRTTDYSKAEQIRKRTPNSFKKAQHVLNYAAKYVKNQGLFSSEKSRAQNLQNAIYDLEKALDQDGFMLEEKKTNGKAWVLIEYFSLFSDTFPNWQKEYQALSKFIPKCF
ncbi:hypothetical protein [Gracilimonas mengyeensis]|uniref:Uncharacterized protein n=1 Tax=Gracilimonas mengyeensis TaxID=1302730 RepID=A0A521ETH0_9BACT|nr:hypothetical protein [Gracilimonas mengyeensis]SMO87223.1 hypothetical protein SAMN06265219_113137 [Gracilimonas mengyeensis]